MEGIHKFVKDTLPHYLRTLPIPKTAAGILKLTGDDWKRLSPFLTVTIIFFYLLLRYFLKREDGGSSKQGKDKVNSLALKKECDKVVDTCDIEDVLKEKDGKKVYCRCWRSKKFPYCDGSHNKHNETTGDNVGPLIVSSGKKAN